MSIHPKPVCYFLLIHQQTVRLFRMKKTAVKKIKALGLIDFKMLINSLVLTLRLMTEHHGEPLL